MVKLKMPMTPEMREYFRQLGRIRGNQLKDRYGSDYFRKIAAKRKRFGRRKASDTHTEDAEQSA